MDARAVKHALLVGLYAALAACGPAAQPAPTASADPATASPTPTATAMDRASASPKPADGALSFRVASGSRAVVRVTEQLADRTDLSDAVLTSDKVSGSFTLLPDGTFSQDPKVTVDLNALTSDDRNRDGFIKRNTLQTGRYPEAVLVPRRTQGLTLPLAASGELSFELIGDLTVHGVTKEVTFAVKALRSGGELTATAVAVPALRFGLFGMEQPRVFRVLSIKDEIRLEVTLKATQQGG